MIDKTIQAKAVLAIELGAAVVCGVFGLATGLAIVAGSYAAATGFGLIAVCCGVIAGIAAWKRAGLIWDLAWAEWRVHAPAPRQATLPSPRLPQDLADIHDEVMVRARGVGEAASRLLELSLTAKEHLAGVDQHVRTVEDECAVLLRKSDRIAKARSILDGTDDDGAPIPQFLKDGPAPPVAPISAVNLDDLARDVEGKQG